MGPSDRRYRAFLSKPQYSIRSANRAITNMSPCSCNLSPRFTEGKIAAQEIIGVSHPRWSLEPGLGSLAVSGNRLQKVVLGGPGYHSQGQLLME